MRDAVIVEAVRTPVGKRNGGLAGTHPVNLSAQVLNALAERTGLDPALVDAYLGLAIHYEHTNREDEFAPLIALGREAHHPSLSERFAEATPAPDNPTAVEAMAHRLKTLEGRKLYAQRKHTPEPVFGIIKSVLGFRQFLLRGLDKVRGEWNLVTMAWNLKRMFVLSPAG
jgi:hypothetical protein